MKEGDYIKFTDDQDRLYDVARVERGEGSAIIIKRGLLGVVDESEYKDTPYIFRLMGYGSDLEEN